MKDLFTTETTIKINVITLDGKKMTKTIFNQLNLKSPFNRNINGYNFKSDGKILGYIKDKGYWLIWTENEKVYKYNLEDIFGLAYITTSSYYYELQNLINPEYYLGDNYLNENHQYDEESYLSNYRLSAIFSPEALDKVKNIVINAQEWKSEILNHQVFL